MYCNICKKEKRENELHKFYWEFWSTDYDETKWTLACDECRKGFLKASSYAQWTGKKNELIDIENNIKERRRVR